MGAVRIIGLVLVAAGILGASSFADEAASKAQLQGKLSELTTWLEASRVNAEWRTTLHLDELDRELNKTSGADASAILGVLARFGGKDPGLALEPFVRTRQAIQEWLASLPPPTDRAICRRWPARPRRHSRPARRSIWKTPERNSSRPSTWSTPKIKAATPGERDWKAQLRLEAIRTELTRKEGPQVSVIQATYLMFLQKLRDLWGDVAAGCPGCTEPLPYGGPGGRQPDAPQELRGGP